MIKENKSEPIFDYATFLANSARGSLEEGVYSASLRLIDALGRLPEILPEVEKDEFLKEITEFANQGKTKSFLESKESYIKFLDEVLRRFAREIKKRNGL
ncbi:MAG: DUF6092 family protein [Thaumarchaeota archaeon]|nr:DUF6092 family protein [Nitrososphaerota archaeon]MCL5069152.1 DUF6092 family protein [Nitrososphaerota archaeon]